MMHSAFQSVERKTGRDDLVLLLDQLVAFLGVFQLLSLLVMLLVIKAMLSCCSIVKEVGRVQRWQFLAALLL